MQLRVLIPLLLLVFATLQGLFVFLQGSESLEAEIEQEAKAAMNAQLYRLQGTFQYLLLEGLREEIGKEITGLGTDTHLKISTLIGANDQILFSMRRDDRGLEYVDALSRGGIQPFAGLQDKLLQVKRDKRPQIFFNDARHLVVGMAPVLLTGEPDALRPQNFGALLLVRDMTQHKSTAQAGFLRSVLPTGGLLLIMSALTAWILHALVNRRINRLVTVAGEFGKGNIAVRSGLSGKDELADLGKAADIMFEQVGKTQEVLHQLSEISSSQKSFDAKVQDLLQVGVRQYDLPIGILARIRGGRYEIVSTVNPGLTFNRGDTFNLVDPFCREELAAKDLISFTNASRTKWRKRPAYGKYEFEAYLGIPVEVKGERYGTLNFSSPTPRRQEFRQSDFDILKLMAQWVAHEIERGRAEAALLGSESRFRTMAEVSPVGIFRTDAEGTCVYVNERWSEITGLAADEAMGNGWADALHPQEREKAFTVWNEASRGNKRFYLEYRFPSPEGRERWVLGQAVAERNSDGTISGYVGSITDISDRKQGEESLTFLARSTSLSTHVFLQDCMRALSKVFAAEYAFVGLLDSEGGKSIHTVAACRGGEIIDNFDYELEDTPCHEVVTGSKQLISHGAITQYPHDALLQELGMEAYFGAPLLNAEGDKFGLVVVGHTQALNTDSWTELLLDVYAGRIARELEREKTTQALRDSELYNRTLFEQSPIGLALTRMNGELVDVNPAYARIIGRTTEEARGLTDWEITPEDHAQQEQAQLRLLKNTGRYGPYEKEYLHKDGRRVPVRLSGLLLEQADETFILSSVEDITERKKAEQELRQYRDHLEELVAARTEELEISNRELEAFSYSVSHDLRSPLRAMDGYSFMLLEDYGPRLDENAREYLQRIRANSQRMGILIDGLLNLSRIQHHTMNIKDLDLSAMVETEMRQLQERNPDRRIEWRVQPGLFGRGDAGLMQSLLSNLLDNAWKYTTRKRQARIEFSGQVDGGEMVYCLSDNGAGFDMRHARKLFQSFQRLHAPDEHYEGTGIGLATVRRIAERHGGRVWAEGEVDKGARFYFTLAPAGRLA